MAWLVGLMGAVVVLHAAGGALPGPPLATPSAWPGWAREGDPVVVAFAVVRLAALVASWYAVAVTAAGVGLRLASASRLASLVDHLTVVPLRRVVAATVTVAVSAGPVATAGAAALSAPTSAPVPVSAPAGTSPPAGSAGDGPPPTVTMHLVTPADGSGPSVPPAPSPTVGSTMPWRPTQPPDSASGPGATIPSTWTVRSGECFWSIADAVLDREWGRPPTDTEIVPYWHRLIEANRATLSDPDNPDLVFAGQVFSLPEV